MAHALGVHACLYWGYYGVQYTLKGRYFQYCSHFKQLQFSGKANLLCLWYAIHISSCLSSAIALLQVCFYSPANVLFNLMVCRSKKCVILIGASLSEPHTSVYGGTISLYVRLYAHTYRICSKYPHSYSGLGTRLGGGR